MNRRTFVSGVSATGVGAVLWAMQPTTEQLSELEQDVQELDQRVSALETQVAESADGAPSPNAAEQVATTSAETVSVSGVGVRTLHVGSRPVQS